ncbi:hypothetical protein JNJ66_02315 [Candidatus Saccharibacteria bacterium]|nr:hypothetical protein [Candidatus Saccharibacteria bacterium]
MPRPRRRSSRGPWYGNGWPFPLIGLAAIMLVFQVLARLVSEDGAVRAAEAFGYTNITVTDRDTFFVGLRGCGNDDLVKFDVTGTGPGGEQRELVVCTGMLKGATVRVA